MPLSPENIEAIRAAQEAQAQQAEQSRQNDLADGCETALEVADAAVSGTSLVGDILSGIGSLFEGLSF
jgi:hypothetical protein